ncbi:hypothetical protein ACFE04_017465 [Oxalis oulophora]
MEENDQSHHVISQLQALQKASRDLQLNPIFTKYVLISSIKTLLDLGNKAASFILDIDDKNLSNLLLLLNKIKTLLENLEKSQGYSLKSILRRKITSYQIIQAGYAIESEIQCYIDRVNVYKLVKALQQEDEEAKLNCLIEFEQRVAQGFDRNFQDLVLKADVFSIIERLLDEEATCLKTVKDQLAIVIVSLVEFNKNVFVGLVLMGKIIPSLVSMASVGSIRALRLLVRLIKSPLTDELLLNNQITKIMGFLSSEDLEIRVAAMDCLFEIAYFGRAETIKAMIDEGLIYKLVGFQRSNLGDNLINMNGESGEESNGECSEFVPKIEGIERNFPFASCVARFAVQIEVGENLEQSERKALKLEILDGVREACVSEAEAASIVAEVLWGSFLGVS